MASAGYNGVQYPVLQLHHGTSILNPHTSSVEALYPVTPTSFNTNTGFTHGASNLNPHTPSVEALNSVTPTGFNTSTGFSHGASNFLSTSISSQNSGSLSLSNRYAYIPTTLSSPFPSYSEVLSSAASAAYSSFNVPSQVGPTYSTHTPAAYRVHPVPLTTTASPAYNTHSPAATTPSYPGMPAEPKHPLSTPVHPSSVYANDATSKLPTRRHTTLSHTGNFIPSYYQPSPHFAHSKALSPRRHSAWPTTPVNHAITSPRRHSDFPAASPPGAAPYTPDPCLSKVAATDLSPRRASCPEMSIAPAAPVQLTLPPTRRLAALTQPAHPEPQCDTPDSTAASHAPTPAPAPAPAPAAAPSGPLPEDALPPPRWHSTLRQVSPVVHPVKTPASPPTDPVWSARSPTPDAPDPTSYRSAFANDCSPAQSLPLPLGTSSARRPSSDVPGPASYRSAYTYSSRSSEPPSQSLPLAGLSARSPSSDAFDPASHRSTFTCAINSARESLSPAGTSPPAPHPTPSPEPPLPTLSQSLGSPQAPNQSPEYPTTDLRAHAAGPSGPSTSPAAPAAAPVPTPADHDPAAPPMPTTIMPNGPQVDSGSQSPASPVPTLQLASLIPPTAPAATSPAPGSISPDNSLPRLTAASLQQVSISVDAPTRSPTLPIVPELPQTNGCEPKRPKSDGTLGIPRAHSEYSDASSSGCSKPSTFGGFSPRDSPQDAAADELSPDLKEGDVETLVFDSQTDSEEKLTIAIPFKETHKRLGLHDFHLVRIVGQGQFGKVWKVRYDGKFYAMKAIRKEFFERKNMFGLLKSERALLATIRHPFITRLRYAFQTPRRAFLVMDYINGGELGRHLKKDPRRFWDEDRVRLYTAQLVLAFEYLHGLGVLYRDLKIDNVMFDADGHAVLIDLGLAKKMAGAKEEGSRQYFGVPNMYFSPEMLRGEDFGFESDWWALGVLVYGMLMGSVPFPAQGIKAMQQAIMGPDEIKIPEARGLTLQCSNFIRKMLAKPLEKRLTTAEAIKMHPWFNDVNWYRVYRRQVPMPWSPPFDDDDLDDDEHQRASSEAMQQPSNSRKYSTCERGMSYCPAPHSEIALQGFSFRYVRSGLGSFHQSGEPSRSVSDSSAPSSQNKSPSPSFPSWATGSGSTPTNLTPTHFNSSVQWQRSPSQRASAAALEPPTWEHH